MFLSKQLTEINNMIITYVITLRQQYHIQCTVA